jgi:TPR repeat protein
MRKPWQALVGALMASLVMVSAGIAGPLEDAGAAFEHGDYETAMRLFRPLAEAGNADAQWMLGLLYRNGGRSAPNFTEALKWFKLAADQGHIRALLHLGQIYQVGLFGVSENKAEAAKWYRLAALQGDAGAQNILGGIYYLRQDYAEAFEWFRKAADQGDVTAQSRVGGMYYEGRGVLQNYVQAHMWLNLVAANTHVAKERDQAIRDLAFVISKMTPAQIAEAQKLASEWKLTNGMAAPSR